MYAHSQLKLTCREVLLPAVMALGLTLCLPLLGIAMFLFRPFIVLLAAGLLIGGAIYCFIESRSHQQAVAPEEIARYRGVRFAKGLSYDRGHCWVQANDRALVGVDALLPALLGSVERVDLPEEETHIRRGETLATLHHADRSVDLPSPISGVIVDVNRRLEDRPQLINSQPFTSGWLAVVHADRELDDASELLSGRRAWQWLRRQVDGVYRLLPDDSDESESLLDRIDETAWKRIQSVLSRRQPMSSSTTTHSF